MILQTHAQQHTHHTHSHTQIGGRSLTGREKQIRKLLSHSYSRLNNLVWDLKGIPQKPCQLRQLRPKYIGTIRTLSNMILLLLGIFVAVRVLHRLYYVLFVPQQRHYAPSFSPKKELEIWIAKNAIFTATYAISNSTDNVKLCFRLLGTGEKKILLANGVGTGLFMWLPSLQAMLVNDPEIFNKCTLIVSSYRGLFADSDDDFSTKRVKITVEKCIEDIECIMKHLRIASLDGIIGWSTGAQIAYTMSITHPHLLSSLFLLNPTAGSTLHYVGQAFAPLPSGLRKYVSTGVIQVADFVDTILPTSIFSYLKVFNDSIWFHLALTLLAFFGGFPPIQPVYFHEYMKDTFQTRSQIRSLFDLIRCLDTPEVTIGEERESSDQMMKDNKLPKNLTELRQKIYAQSVLVSSIPDFITGQYLSTHIEKRMRSVLSQTGSILSSGKTVRHVRFSMGSHFVLIEWPHLVGQELAIYVNQIS